MIDGTNAAERAGRYRARGWWTGERLIDRLATVVERAPQSTAVTTPSDRMSYGGLWDSAGRLAAEWASGPPDQVAMIVMANSIDWVVAHAAIGRRGWVPASIPAASSVDHLAHAIRLAHTGLVMADPTSARVAEAAVRAVGGGVGLIVVDRGRASVVVEPSFAVAAPGLAADVGQLFFTSSTTGPPKAVVHTHDTLGAMHTLMAERFALDSSTPILMPSPFGHSVGGMHGVRMAQWIGAELVTLPEWDVEVALDLAARRSPKYTAAATPFLSDLVRSPVGSGIKFESVEWFLCGGAAVPPELIRRARIELPNTVVTPLWGMTEGGVTTGVAQSRPDQLERTVGTPMPGLEIAVDTPEGIVLAGAGEVVMRGPAVFTGYLGDEELYAASVTTDGWVRTGDLGVVDDEGYLAITGRLKDLVVRGGVNIAPTETEHAIASHPSVHSVAVVGWPDSRLGERLCAVVQFDSTPLELDALIDHCVATGLSRRLLPERLVVVDDFPRTAAGKIRKGQLRDDLVGGVVHRRRIGDIDVLSRTWGSGPPVVLVHGLGEDSTSWQTVAPMLTGRTVHAIDLRGHGGTSLGTADGSLTQLAHDLNGYLAAVTGPAPVVGFSLGGTVVLQAAAAEATLVTHALMIGTSCIVGRSAAEFFRTRIAQVADGPTDEFLRAFAEDNAGMIASGADPTPILRQRLHAIGDARGYANAATAMAHINDEPLTPLLASICTRADVIAGTEDQFCPPKASQMIVDGLSDGHLHHIDGAGHLISVDRPSELADLLGLLLDTTTTDQIGKAQ